MADIRVTTSHKTLTVLRDKVAVVGDPHVGKTALIQLFVSGGQSFPKNYLMTSGVELSVSPVEIPDTSIQVELYLFDVGGQSIFHQREYFANALDQAGSIMLVYDITNRDSFKNCAKWVRDASARSPTGRLGGVLVANKVDLRDTGREAVSAEEGRRFAESLGLDYVETSALAGSEIKAPFQTLAEGFHRTYAERMGEVPSLV